MFQNLAAFVLSFEVAESPQVAATQPGGVGWGARMP